MIEKRNNDKPNEANDNDTHPRFGRQLGERDKRVHEIADAVLDALIAKRCTQYEWTVLIPRINGYINKQVIRG